MSTSTSAHIFDFFTVLKMELNLQQRVCIKFCVKNGFNGVKTLEMLGNFFGSDTLKKTAIYEWHECKSCREFVEDDEHWQAVDIENRRKHQ